MSHNDELRVEEAARVLIHVQDNMPGDDLGQSALALAWIELRAAVVALDKIRGEKWKFDCVAALEELRENANAQSPQFTQRKPLY